MTRILISVDMEGISGVVSRRETATGWPHGSAKGNDYERARAWMTADANAAIRGAFEGGATEVLVADAHDGMLNLIWNDLDPRAELIRGYENRTCGMSAGLDAASAFDGLFFVGYHARANDARGVLSHTFTGPDVLWEVRLNGESASEARFNAAVAGQFGVPVGLITGDDVICEETCRWLPHVETAVVKVAIDRFTARCLPQPAALDAIQAAATRAARGLNHMRAYQLSSPIRLETVWRDSSLAAAAARLPRAERTGEREVAYSATDALEAYRVCDVAIELASAVVARERT
jgi:D-amino peptidase